MENEKYLFVVSGAAGTGKDSVVSALLQGHPEIEKTVSATTRSPRPGEQEGVDYYYRTKEQFQQLIDQDEVVEHNFFNGNYYGTLKEEVNKRLNAGKLVVRVIDVHGRGQYPPHVSRCHHHLPAAPLHPGAGAPPARPRAPRPRRASGSAWRSPAMSWPSRINSPSSWSTTRWMPAPPDSMMSSASVRA